MSEHECDLFLLSSHQHYYANNGLAEFARRGERNINGWGIAGYRDGRVNVLRSADPALKPGSGDISREFSIAARAISSSLILGHLRLTSRGTSLVENNHPFNLEFLGYEWSMVHNGTASRHESLVPDDERFLNKSDNDSARVFEFLRKHIIDYCQWDYRKSLIEGCRKAYGRLLREDQEGKFNIILSNGYLSFLFIHFRPFYILNREKRRGDALLASTLKLTDDEEWIEVGKQPDKNAKMLVCAGPTLIFNGDVPR